MEKVTVVVPVYNTANYLERCLESIRNQTYQNLEVLIINDGSTDNSEAVIKAYLTKIKDKRFKYHFKSNSGVGATRNLGIELATGKYISFIDSDDEIALDFYEKMLTKIHPDDIFVMNKAFYKVRLDQQELIEIDNNAIRLFKSPSCCLKVFNLEKIKELNIKFENSTMGEDLEFTAKLMINNDHFATCDEPLYYYYMRDDSVTHTYDLSMLSLLEAIDRIEAYAKEQDKFVENKDRLEYMNISHILIALMKRMYNVKNFKSIMSKLIGYVELKYPSWYNNKYIKTELNSSEKKYLSDLYLQKEQEFLQYLAKFTNY